MPEASAPTGAGGGLREPVLTFLAATALACALFWTAQVVPLVQANLHGAIALVFLFAPRVAARASGRPFDYHAAGLRLDPVGGNLAVLGAALAITWPLFFGGFLVYYGLACTPGAPRALAALMEQFSPNCALWLGWSGASLRLPPDFALLALTQIVVVGVPEELFFRGYLYTRLEERWPSRRALLGAPVGRPLLATSALFALGHVLVDFNPQRLLVFVPGLVFGWMRARTGSIAAATLFHALCNLFSDVLHTSFLR